MCSRSVCTWPVWGRDRGIRLVWGLGGGSSCGRGLGAHFCGTGHQGYGQSRDQGRLGVPPEESVRSVRDRLRDVLDLRHRAHDHQPVPSGIRTVPVLYAALFLQSDRLAATKIRLQLEIPTDFH